jgi:phospholipid transport system substrate-binding protein
MKRFLLLLGIFVTTQLFAVQSAQIKSVVDANIQKALTILSNDGLSKEEKSAQLYTMFDPLFNYELMAKLSLGSHWNNLSSDEKKEFVQKFVAKLKNSYMDTLTQYQDEVIRIDDMQQQKNRIRLLTTIHSNGGEYEVVYKFYEASKDEWFIYDMDILGVSIVQSFRNQFAGYKNESFEELLSLLEKNSI